MDILFQALYFFLPAYAANMAPVFAAYIRLPLETPLSEKYLGKNKTYRGLYSGFAGAFLVILLQAYFQNRLMFESIRVLDYTQGIAGAAFLAALFSFGALGGDALKSLAKRAIGIAPGASWVPFDQIDFILGTSVLLAAAGLLPKEIFLAGIIVTPFLHAFANIIAYFLGLKKVWW